MMATRYKYGHVFRMGPCHRRRNKKSSDVNELSIVGITVLDTQNAALIGSTRNGDGFNINRRLPLLIIPGRIWGVVGILSIQGFHFLTIRLVPVCLFPPVLGNCADCGFWLVRKTVIGLLPKGFQKHGLPLAHRRRSQDSKRRLLARGLSSGVWSESEWSG